MKNWKSIIKGREERELILIYVVTVVLCAEIIADSVFFLFSQTGAGGAAADSGQMLFIVSLLCFLVLIFFFVRVLRRASTEIRVQQAQLRILQSMSGVIAFEYNVSDDTIEMTYCNGDGKIERRSSKNYFKGRGFCGLVRDDYWYAFEEAFRRMLSVSASASAEFPMRLVGRETRWYRFTCQSMGDVRGKVFGIAGSAVDVDELIIARNQAREEAATDAMTGLLGKAAFAARAVERMGKEKAAPATLLMLDLDNFKEINDTKGHLEGDRMLSGVASLLQRVFSADDLIGRFGGDEFIVFMQGITMENTEKKLLHFRRRLEELMEEQGYTVTCSIGAFCEGGGGMTFEELVKRADEAMYEAKKSGKNSFVLMDGHICMIE